MFFPADIPLRSTLPGPALTHARASSHQRSHGVLEIAFRRRGERTVLADLRQEGCLKARFPRPHDGLEAVTLNTSGGIAGGDGLRSAITLHEATRVTLAAQAAERFYRTLPSDLPARIRTAVTLAPGAALEWLPQEAILFDGCAFDRALDVTMAADAAFLGVESLVFGRAAMGERLRSARIADAIRIRRGGQLVLHDSIRLSGRVEAVLARPAVAAGAQAVATLVLVAPDAESRLEALRTALAPFEAGASAWNGMLLARILAPDGAALRAAVVAGLECLRGGRSLPRVWMC
ncbi:urease accessory protein UreD [Rhodovastum atsumiense]|uniref:urease accessory protein UreD n=1 Tax=Rhodovastum atsumiense TaxID=504468 RepID=UPI002024A54C|nr:urease accessory protein UreD [Rhodovastum atsumiense]